MYDQRPLWGLTYSTMIEKCDSYVTTRCHVMQCEYEALSQWGEPLRGTSDR